MLVLSPFVAVLLGSANVGVSDIFSVIAKHVFNAATDVEISRATDAIVWQVRLPRVLLAVTVGAILGVSGVVLQAIVRNVLAEPYVLGVSSGASVGATIAIIFVSNSLFSVSLMAFVGAIIATVVVLLIAGNTNSPLKLVLAGLATSFGFQALTNLLLFSSGTPETTQSVMFWMLGSLAHSGWEDIWWVWLVAIGLTLVAWLSAPWLDAIGSGDNTALSVGINPALVRLLLLIPVSLAVAAAVAVSGGIGFVGLVVPHLMRGFIGSAHRQLVLATACSSALFLLWTDTAARVLFAPAELPIGVITGLVGAPCLMFLLRNKNA